MMTMMLWAVVGGFGMKATTVGDLGGWCLAEDVLSGFLYPSFSRKCKIGKRTELATGMGDSANTIHPVKATQFQKPKAESSFIPYFD